MSYNPPVTPKKKTMGCLFPNMAFDTGCLTANGKRDFFLMPYASGDIVSVDTVSKYKHVAPGAPMVVINGRTYLKDPVPIPCNHCVGCRMEKARQWKVRVCLEASQFPPDDCHFVTLTYDNGHLPINDDGEPFLNKRDFQLFMKRLRKHGTFRYFGCGEYGEIGCRPHFHCILFGRLADKRPIGVNEFSSSVLSASWPFGFVDLQAATPGSIAYTCGYVEKKCADPNYNRYPVKPFLLMSDRPGIGFNALRSIDLEYDAKVYGLFGSSHSSTIPQALLRKLEAAPGYDDYKSHVSELGRASVSTKLAVYNTASKCRLGDLREEAIYDVLQKNRSDKL